MKQHFGFDAGAPRRFSLRQGVRGRQGQTGRYQKEQPLAEGEVFYRKGIAGRVHGLWGGGKLT